MTRNKLRYITALLVMAMYAIQSYAQEVDSLSYYLEIAGQNNPDVKADFLAYKAALQKVPQSGAYQDRSIRREGVYKHKELLTR